MAVSQRRVPFEDPAVYRSHQKLTGVPVQGFLGFCLRVVCGTYVHTHVYIHMYKYIRLTFDYSSDSDG